MFFPESILVTKVQVVYVKMFVDLIENYFLKYFRQCWQYGNWAIIIKHGFIVAFVYWNYFSNF